MNLIAQQILDFNDRQPVTVSKWGCTLTLKPMSGTDRDTYDVERYHARESKSPDYWRARYLVRCIFDSDGHRVFTDDQAQQLAEKSGETLKELFDLVSSASTQDAAKNS